MSSSGARIGAGSPASPALLRLRPSSSWLAGCYRHWDGRAGPEDERRESLPERWQVSRDLEEAREQAMELSKGRAFQAEGTTNATVLAWKSTWRAPECQGVLRCTGFDGSNKLFPRNIRPKGAPDFQNGDETTRTPGGRNSNMGHGGSKDLQKAPPSAASTL
ncbi:uncharacterized protein ACBT57_007699 isoform 1-T1 [Dama dama]